jgi:hypothetical protein
MVSHVQVIAILMIVHGSLTALMGVLCGALGPAMFALMRLEEQNAQRPPDPADQTMLTAMSVVYGVGGLLLLIVGVLTLIGGIRALKFRNRTFVLVALFANALPVFTIYCTATALAVLIYGLIVMFNDDVVRAFQMAEEGASPAQIKEHFSGRYGRVRRPDWEES